MPTKADKPKTKMLVKKYPKKEDQFKGKDLPPTMETLYKIAQKEFPVGLKMKQENHRGPGSSYYKVKSITKKGVNLTQEDSGKGKQLKFSVDIGKDYESLWIGDISVDLQRMKKGYSGGISQMFWDWKTTTGH